MYYGDASAPFPITPKPRHCFVLALCLNALLCLPAWNIAAAENSGASKKALDGLTAWKWDEVGAPEAIDILDMLSVQAMGNYERIRTWQGTCSSQSQRLFSPRQAAETLQGAVKQELKSPVIQDSHYVTDFAIDVAQNFAYRWMKDTKLTWIEKESAKAIKVPQVTLATQRSVVTPEHYLHFEPDKKFDEFVYVPGHPEAMGKRAAFRDPTTKAEREYYTDLVDPRRFYYFSGETPFWKDVQLTLRCLKGEMGTDKQKKCAQATRVYKASDMNGTWYRTDFELTGPIGPVVEAKVWSPQAGMNPVQFSVWKGRVGQELMYEARWEYQTFGGVHVPVFWREAQYRGDTTLLNRNFKLDKCVINEPIAPSQFSYQGLGMKDGDLVLDRIDNVCYSIKDGQPVKLANFGEKYVPPGERSHGLSRKWIVTSNVVLLVLLIVIFIARKYRKRLA